MAKKRSNKVSSHKQTIKNPRTAAKQSAAAKRRRRIHGRFASGSLSAAEWKDRRGKGDGGERYGMTAAELKADVLSRKYANQKLVKENPEEAALRLSEAGTQIVHGKTPSRDQLREGPVRTTSGRRRDILQSVREGKWRSEAGLYTNPQAIQRGKPPKYTPVSQFMKKELAPSHKKAIEGMLSDPNSAFNKGLPPSIDLHRTKYSPGQRNRLRLYSESLQQGASHEEAIAAISGERRGRKPVSSRVRGSMGEISPEDAGITQKRPAAGRKGKFVSSAPSESEFSVGVSVPRVDTVAELANKFPGKSERELVEVQQNQRQYLAQEFAKNQRWAHETRAANMLGKNAMPSEGPDNVTIFTSSLGHPNVTVPTDSLVGQYIIRRRKTALSNMGYPRSQLRGRFPEAVRDKHVAEMLTGRYFGAEGRAGVFKRSGWRAGSKTSKGFGHPVPVGSQIIYDSAGRPMYDSQGNIRFSEGFTRPFSVGSERELGLGIYIG